MSIQELTASSRSSYLELAHFQMLEWGAYVRGERRVPNSEIHVLWRPLELVVKRENGKKSLLQDAYQFGYFSGMSLVASDKMRQFIETNFPSQCEFLPVEVQGMRGYWAVWANAECDDAIDFERSVISQGPGGIKHVKRIAIDESRLRGHTIFRLSPKFSGVEEMVTDRFVELALQAQLIGLAFQNRRTA